MRVESCELNDQQAVTAQRTLGTRRPAAVKLTLPILPRRRGGIRLEYLDETLERAEAVRLVILRKVVEFA